MAVIRVGAATETELKEKKHRVEDALSAARAAVEEGIVPGGEISLINAGVALEKLKVEDEDEQVGINIVRKALEAPIRRLAQNAGQDGSVIIDSVRRAAKDQKNKNIGYNVLTGEYVDMIKAGIIDPVKVVRGALENAASIAAMILTTDALVTDVPEKEKAPAMPALPETLDAALSLGTEFAPANVGARAQELARRRGVQIAKGAFLPTVSLVAGYSYAEEPSTFINSDEQFSYGVRASMPIFNGGLNLSRVREARALHASAEASVEEAERRIAAAVTSAFEQLVASRIAIKSATAQVAANELALTGVRREAQLGTRSTLDVLNAEQEYFNSKVALANAERDERVASFALLGAAGVLNPEAVGIAEAEGVREDAAAMSAGASQAAAAGAVQPVGEPTP